MVRRSQTRFRPRNPIQQIGSRLNHSRRHPRRPGPGGAGRIAGAARADGGARWIAAAKKMRSRFNVNNARASGVATIGVRRRYCSRGVSMRAILMIIMIVAMASTAVAQQVVTPSNPLGQGFAPNGLQSTPSAPGQGVPPPSIQGQAFPGQTSNEPGSHLYQQNGSAGPNLNWQYSQPAASGRTLPAAPERPMGPLR